MDNFKKLIHLLSDGHFHSGENLGKALGLSRSAIWKLTEQFTSYDIELESITGKGYRIPNGFSLLDKNKILEALPPLSSISKDIKAYPDIEIWDSLPSTNDYLMDKLAKAQTNICCVAERQTQGKGRQGRSWFSPYGSNIYFSLLWHFSYDLSELSGLSLVTAIALAKVLQNLGIKDEMGLKWPNDLLWKKQKLAGVLIEVSGETQNSSRAVIGIGLNVAMPKRSAQKSSQKISQQISQQMSQQIDQAWTDLFQITGKKIDRNHLVASILVELMKNLEKFQNEGFQAFMRDWQTLDLCCDKPVTLLRTSETLQGIGQGINEKGYFLLKDNSGNVTPIASGEISLRLSN